MTTAERTEIAFEGVPTYQIEDGLEVLTHSAECISVRTGDGESVTLNRIPYTLTAILYLDSDGSWRVGHALDDYDRPQDGPRRWYGSLYGNRQDQGVLGDSFTPSAKAKAAELAERIGNEWAHAHQTEITEGQQRTDRQRARTLLQDRAKLAEQLAEIDAELASLEVHPSWKR